MTVENTMVRAYEKQGSFKHRNYKRTATNNQKAEIFWHIIRKEEHIEGKRSREQNKK